MDDIFFQPPVKGGVVAARPQNRHRLNWIDCHREFFVAAQYLPFERDYIIRVKGPYDPFKGAAWSFPRDDMVLVKRKRERSNRVSNDNNDKKEGRMPGLNRALDTCTHVGRRRFSKRKQVAGQAGGRL